MGLAPIPDPKKAVRVAQVEPEKRWAPYREPLTPGEHPHNPPEGLKVIGKRTPLVDGRKKVTGEALYTDDIHLANMLHCKILRSPHAHARVRRVDTSKAEALPGVAAVLTGRENNIGFGVLPLTQDETALAGDKVRFVGDGVAAVAAEDERTAIEALKLIEVEYEPLPEYLDPLRGLGPVEEKIHPDIGIDGSNVQKHVDQYFGDVDSAISAAKVVVREHFSCRGVTHAFTEPHATIAHYDADGRLTVWSAQQVPHYLHRALAKVTGLDMHRIRVVRPHVGGGFGGKSDPFPHEMAVALLSMRTRRPVKILFDREEVFISNHGRHPTETDMLVATDAGGRLSALDIEAVIDGGAWASFGIISTYYNGVLSMGPYKIPNFRYKGRRVYTNHLPSGAMRGHGAVNSRFMLETLLDMAAECLGVDPFDLRLANLMPPYSHTINDFRITSNGLKECLEKVRERSGWDSRFRKLPPGKGVGLGCGFYISGSNLPIHWDWAPENFPQSTVHIKIDMDGGVTVHTGAAEIGQGSDTVAAQCVAEILGCSIERIRVRSEDSDTAPIDLGSYSSRVTFMMGNAARRAAERVREELARAAAELTHHQPELMLFKDETIYPASRPDLKVTFDQALHKAMERRGALVARGTYTSPKLGGKFKGATAGLAPAYSMSAYVAEVDVDLETFQWRCTKVWAAHDCGKALNPLAVEGQIEGSIHMGLGQVFGETLEYNTAVLRNPNLLDYKIPTPHEMPEVEVIIVESNDAEGPFGAKEAGEGPLLPILPAVANAIYDAIGARSFALPITPDRLWELVEKKHGGKVRKPVQGRPPEGANKVGRISLPATSFAAVPALAADGGADDRKPRK
jgi:4-hydroxybenzoyl-CoA reductase alpha subunit